MKHFYIGSLITASIATFAVSLSAQAINRDEIDQLELVIQNAMDNQNMFLPTVPHMGAINTKSFQVHLVESKGANVTSPGPGSKITFNTDKGARGLCKSDAAAGEVWGNWTCQVTLNGETYDLNGLY